MQSINDPELLDALERLGGRPLDLHTWRVAWKTRDVLDFGSGGRWNPPGRLDALYTSLEQDGAIAEVYHHLSRAPVFSTADKVLYSLEIRTKSTLVLDDWATLGQLGVDEQVIRGDDLSRTRETGSAAFLMEYDSMLLPSARWDCNNLIVFPDYLPLAEITVSEGQPINWPAWRENNDAKFAQIKRGMF